MKGDERDDIALIRRGQQAAQIQHKHGGGGGVKQRNQHPPEGENKGHTSINIRLEA
jgi:hypothetical protein